MNNGSTTSILAVITARGGSKRIPRKNIRPFNGRPAIAYAISAALDSGCFDEVMVSTDDEEIAEVARSCGASVPFMRSRENADDFSTTADVLTEVVECYRKEMGRDYDAVCCLYPTALFVTADRLKECCHDFTETGADALIPVVAYSFPVQRLFLINDDGRIEYKWPQYTRTRTQDLTPCYHDAGQFYFIKTEVLLSGRTMVPANTIPCILRESEVQDIDTEDDWIIAEEKYRKLHRTDIISHDTVSGNE